MPWPSAKQVYLQQLTEHEGDKSKIIQGEVVPGTWPSKANDWSLSPDQLLVLGTSLIVRLDDRSHRQLVVVVSWLSSFRYYAQTHICTYLLTYLLTYCRDRPLRVHCFWCDCRRGRAVELFAFSDERAVWMSVEAGIVDFVSDSTGTTDCSYWATLHRCRATQALTDSRHCEVCPSEEAQPWSKS